MEINGLLVIRAAPHESASLFASVHMNEASDGGNPISGTEAATAATLAIVDGSHIVFTLLDTIDSSFKYITCTGIVTRDILFLLANPDEQIKGTNAIPGITGLVTAMLSARCRPRKGVVEVK